ncbi:LacI family DNA-binding transcriptional regulator [Cryptosporangium arvum]|uniref:LacI family DNA-binding transcriptional regulator n=1 Tax=Cryptosporangium arvum TaxID=80871 RepID=UPI0004B7E477|nr:LacI family DNA-binding transcriptional regulator [Cryptosporangium arvum]
MANGARSGWGPRPTLDAVAELAGVSRATVSRVVNESSKVGPEVRARVEDAIRTLGYVPNPVARSLVTRRTDAVGLVVGEPSNMVMTDPYLSRLILATSRELGDAGRQPVLLLTGGENDHARIAAYLAGGHVDGAIVLSVHRTDPLLPALRNLPIPVMFGGRPWGDDVTAAGSIDVDQREGARLAVEHLVGLGRRQIATITGSLDQRAAVERLDGYQAVLAEHRDTLGEPDPALIAHGDFTRAGGERAMSELLKRVPSLDAVFAASDLTAAGAIGVLRRAGLRVPEDVAVIGFDDLEEIAAWTEPPLTTVHQPVSAFGRRLVAALLEMLSGGEPVREMLPVRLVTRASA